MRATLLSFIAINVLLLCISIEAGIAKVSKVAILPFQTNADENIDYINRGIREMLTARVTYGDTISVVEHGVVQDAMSEVHPRELTSEEVQALGSVLGVDYVIFGSISKIGNNVSIDINILNLIGGGITKPVFAHSVGLDEVIPKVSGLAQEIVDTISTGFKSLPPAETAIQPTGVDAPLLKEKSRGSEVVPEKIKESDLSAGEGSLEVSEPSSDEAEEKREPLNEQTAEPRGFKEKFLERKSEVDSLDENPAYQKSVDDLEETTTPSDEVEGKREPLDNQPAETEELEKKFSEKKKELNVLEENPVYQKSVDDLEESSKTITEEVSD